MNKSKKQKSINKISQTLKKRIRAVWICFSLLLIILIIRIGYWQIIKGEYLSASALQNQATKTTITAKRGTIYDANRKNLGN